MAEADVNQKKRLQQTRSARPYRRLRGPSPVSRRHQRTPQLSRKRHLPQRQVLAGRLRRREMRRRLPVHDSV